MRCLDLGANIGYYTLLFRSLVGPHGKVFAVEPDSRNIPFLEMNVHLNGWADNISVIKFAIGAFNSRSSFIQAPYSNLSKLGSPQNGGESNFVEVISLNSLGDLIGNVDIIRMDIEGAELLVLSKSNLKYLSALRTGAKIFVEIHPKNYLEIDNGYSFSQMVETLESAGFSKHSVISSGITFSQIFRELNLKPVRRFNENKWSRFQFDNINTKDLIQLGSMVPKVVRYVIFTKEPRP
jgi:FkbM family methyltransferase